MNAIYEAASEVATFLAAKDWRFCIIGGLAVQRWGEPRTTVDADLTLFTGFGDEPTYADALLARFAARRADARDFSLVNRVLLIRATNGTPIDVSFAALPFEAEMLERASIFLFGDGCALPTCSAEDLFIMKAFASRPQDWIDARGIATRQEGHLDQRYILKHLVDLCELKEAPEIVTQARKILELAS